MNICRVADALIYVGRMTRTEGRTDMMKFNRFFAQITLTRLKNKKSKFWRQTFYCVCVCVCVCVCGVCVGCVCCVFVCVCGVCVCMFVCVVCGCGYVWCV